MNSHQARKRFGQNFLHDAGIIQRIVASLHAGPDDHFVEIGPGKGAITKPLAQQAGRLDVIEIDRDLAAALRTQPWFETITLHQTDALKFRFADIHNDRALRLVGNLPYNISTPLLFHILASHELFSDVHVMLQKEVVQRMTASPGSKAYGRLTVALAAFCEVESLFVIKPGSFSPAPQVDSAFARLTLLPAPLITPAEQPHFDTLVRQAFGQRRKQLGNALRSLLTTADFVTADIDPASRAETLSVQQFIALTRQIATRE